MAESEGAPQLPVIPETQSGLRKTESASAIKSQFSAVCDGASIKLGFLGQHEGDGTQNAQKVNELVKKLNELKKGNGQYLYPADHRFTSEDIVNLPKQIADLTGEHGKLAGLYTSFTQITEGAGNSSDSAVAMVVFLDSIKADLNIPNPTIVQIRAALKHATDLVTKIIPQTHFAAVIVALDGKLAVENTGNQDIVFINTDGSHQVIQDYKRLPTGLNPVETKSLTKGQTVIICDNNKGRSIDSETAKKSPDEIVNHLIANNSQAAEAGRITTELIKTPKKTTTPGATVTDKPVDESAPPAVSETPSNQTQVETADKLNEEWFYEDTKTNLSRDEFKKQYPEHIQTVLGVDNQSGLLYQAMALIPQQIDETPLTYEIRVLSEIGKILRYPKDVNKNPELKKIIDNVNIPLGQVSFVLMATEAVAMDKMDIADQEKRVAHNRELNRELRRHVKTEVSHIGATMSAEGDLNKIFTVLSEQDRKAQLQQLVADKVIDLERANKMEASFLKYRTEMKLLPTRDLYAFTLMGDALLDTTAGDSTYRLKMQALQTVINNKSATHAEKAGARRTLVDVRKDFYQNFIEALSTLDKPVDSRKDSTNPRDHIIISMQSQMNTLRHDPQIVETLLKNYKGVGLEESGSMLRDRNIVAMRRIFEGERLQFFDYALKGADLMRRRISYSIDDQLYKAGNDLFYKRFVQRDKQTPVESTQNKPADTGKPVVEQDKVPVIEEAGTPQPGPVKPEDGETPQPGPVKEQPPEKITELNIGIASAKQRVQTDEQESMEVAEERGREMARARMTEDRSKWEGRFSWLRQAIPRFWKYNIGETATYNKEKAHAFKLLAEAGIEATSLPYAFISEVDETARNLIRAERHGFFRRIGGGIRDLGHEITFTEKDLHHRRTEIVRELRSAVDDPTALATKLADPNSLLHRLNASNPGLLANFSDILTGDYQATSAWAKRVSADLGGNILRSAAGEKSAEQIALDKDNPLRQFLISKVIEPIISAGLTNPAGLPAIKKIVQNEVQNYFFSKDFVEWRNSLTTEQQSKLDLSLSYGMDVIDLTETVLLPNAKALKNHNDGTLDLKEYVDNVVLKVKIGTVEAGQKGVINEGAVERHTGRTVTNERVLELYRELQNGTSAIPIHKIPAGEINAAVNRASLIGTLGALGTNQVLMGVGAGVALYGTRFLATRVGRVVVPVIGGSLVAGAFRAAQERRMFTREWEQHNVERELGYSFTTDMRRRQQMEHYAFHVKDMKTDFIDPLHNLTAKIETGTASTVDASQLLGLLAEKQARLKIADARGIGLLSASDPQQYQTEFAKLDIECAKAIIDLNTLTTANPTMLTDIKNSLGITDPAATLDNVIGILQTAVETNIETGADVNATLNPALTGRTVVRNESIACRERAFRAARRRRTAGAFVTTAAFGVVSGGISVGLNAAAAEAANGNLPWLQGALERVGLLHTEAPNTTQVINDVTLRLPTGYTGVAVDEANHVMAVSDPSGSIHAIPFATDPVTGNHTFVTPPGWNITENNVTVPGAVSTASHWTPQALGATTETHNNIQFKIPNGFTANDTPNGITLTDQTGNRFEFEYLKDVTGKVTAVKTLAQPADSQLAPANFKPVSEVVSPSTVLKGSLKLTADLKDYLVTKAESIGMKLVDKPDAMNFHVLWPGQHAGHELEMHWGKGVDSVTHMWFQEKGVINFGGTITEGEIISHVNGLQPKIDPELNRLISLAPDKEIKSDDLFVIMAMKNGQRIYAALNEHGNYQLPEVLQDAKGQPNPELFKWIGIAALEKTDGTGIVQAHDWSDAGRPDITGIKEHFLASQTLSSGDLPPQPEPTTPTIVPGSVEFNFSKLVETTTKEPDAITHEWIISRSVAGHTDFAIPFIPPRRPLEAPEDKKTEEEAQPQTNQDEQRPRDDSGSAQGSPQHNQNTDNSTEEDADQMPEYQDIPAPMPTAQVTQQTTENKSEIEMPQKEKQELSQVAEIYLQTLDSSNLSDAALIKKLKQENPEAIAKLFGVEDITVLPTDRTLRDHLQDACLQKLAHLYGVTDETKVKQFAADIRRSFIVDGENYQNNLVVAMVFSNLIKDSLLLRNTNINKQLEDVEYRTQFISRVKTLLALPDITLTPQIAYLSIASLDGKNPEDLNQQTVLERPNSDVHISQKQAYLQILEVINTYLNTDSQAVNIDPSEILNAPPPEPEKTVSVPAQVTAPPLPVATAAPATVYPSIPHTPLPQPKKPGLIDKVNNFLRGKKNKAVQPTPIEPVLTEAESIITETSTADDTEFASIARAYNKANIREEKEACLRQLCDALKMDEQHTQAFLSDISFEEEIAIVWRSNRQIITDMISNLILHTPDLQQDNLDKLTKIAVSAKNEDESLIFEKILNVSKKTKELIANIDSLNPFQISRLPILATAALSNIIDLTPFEDPQMTSTDKLTYLDLLLIFDKYLNHQETTPPISTDTPLSSVEPTDSSSIKSDETETKNPHTYPFEEAQAELERLLAANKTRYNKLK